MQEPSKASWAVYTAMSVSLALSKMSHRVLWELPGSRFEGVADKHTDAI